MPEFGTFPDSEALTGQIIRDAGHFGTRVYSSIPKNPTYPICTVKRIGGRPEERRWLDTADLQIDVWGENKSDARDGAVAARLALLMAEGTSFSISGGDVDDAFITAVQDLIGLTFLPDPTSQRDRYLFQMRITLHGRNSGS